MLYLYVKAFHVIAVIAWMAGMLYLPRLFVYHAATASGSEQSETFKIMERRLLNAIMTPAMIVTWLLGIYLVLNGGFLSAPWFHAKFVLVLGLTAMHGLFARWQRQFERDANRHTQKFYRIVNEIPTLLMIGIVVLAVAKPF